MYLHCALSCGAVYCNRSRLSVCLFVFFYGSVTTITRNCVHRSSPNLVYKVVTISSWLNFGRPAPPGRESAARRIFFLAPPYYSQRAVFASPPSAFFTVFCIWNTFKEYFTQHWWYTPPHTHTHVRANRTKVKARNYTEVYSHSLKAVHKSWWQSKGMQILPS